MLSRRLDSTMTTGTNCRSDRRIFLLFRWIVIGTGKTRKRTSEQLTLRSFVAQHGVKASVFMFLLSNCFSCLFKKSGGIDDMREKGYLDMSPEEQAKNILSFLDGLKKE